jgi:transcriptional regulator with XRE-family HTH domain
MLTRMDDQRIGAALRAIRIRKGWRQTDLSQRARVSPSVVARIERGGAANVALGKVRRIASTLGARFETFVRWEGADLPRLLDQRHAAMHEAVANPFAALEGWVIEPEVSFSIHGERGIIDVLAWHPTRRILLVIELKTEVLDVNELLGTLDQKRRLAADIAHARKWNPVAIASWVVVGTSRSNRRAIAEHSTVLRAKLPMDGRGIGAWLRDPHEAVNALSFMPSVQGVHPGPGTTPVQRVDRPKRRSAKHEPSV